MDKKAIYLSLIILLHLLFIFFSAKQMFYGDEAYFMIASKEILNGNVAGRGSYGAGQLYNSSSTMFIHPPTYVYLVTLSIFLFGENSYSPRLVSSFFAIGIIILIYLLTKSILEKRKVTNSGEWALFAAFLYAINPLAIQNSILLDIDGGLLNFALLLFVYLYTENKNSIILFFAMLFVFFSKMTGQVILFMSLIILNLLLKDKKEITKIIKIYIASWISFIAIFYLFSKIFSVDISPLFVHNSALGILKSLWNEPYLIILRSLWALKLFIYFSTPFLFFLFIISIYFFTRNYFLEGPDYLTKNKDLFFIFIYPIMTILFYLITGLSAWNFPKYHITAVPYIVILIVYFTPKKIINLKKIIPLLILTLLILSTYFIFILKDPLIPEVNGRVKTTNLINIAKLVSIRFFLYAFIPIFLCLGLFERIPKRRIWLILLFLLISTSIYIDIKQSTVDYSTHNMYGDKGLKEVLNYMKDKPPKEILANYHIVYYINYTDCYELGSLLYDKENMIKTINKVNWIILYQKDIDLIGSDNLKDFILDKEIESYKILKRIK